MNEERRYKLYGFTRILGFPCACYGRKSYFFALRWVKELKCFKVYKGHTTTEEVIHNYINNGDKMFFGIIVADDKR